MASWALYAFIEYCTYNAVSLLVLALATIVQNTKITACVSLYNASKEEPVVAEEESKPTAEVKVVKEVTKETAHSWRCSNCGNMRTQSPCPNCGNE